MTDNAEQIEYWNERAGRRWVRADDWLAQMLTPVSTVLLDRVAPQTGERVLDVGCGAGQTTMEVARRVGQGGRVVGVDVSSPLLALAEERKGELPQLQFVKGDAQTHAFAPASFDLVMSRFGVMFFADPVAAFTNLANATASGGRLGFVCWRSIIENPWFGRPLAALAQHVEPPPKPEPGAPGPFAFDRRDYLREVLTRAGWQSVAIDPVDLEARMGADADDAVRFASEVGATAQPLSEAAPDARTRAVDAIRSVFADVQREDGVFMPAAIWLVTASR